MAPLPRGGGGTAKETTSNERTIDEEGEAAGGRLNHLPLELQIEILFLLPVQTLLVLRAVCKWFLSVIDDSSFVSSHLRRFPDNVHETRILNVDLYPDSPWYTFPSAVDGLVLLVRHRTHNALLWNPSARKALDLPPLESGELKHFALGHDAARDDYRVLAMCPTEAWVYSLKSGAWTDITLRSGYRHKSVIDVDCSQSLCFKGGVIWIEFSAKSKWMELVWFDFGSERFSYSDKMVHDTCSVLMTLDGGSSVGLWKYDVDVASVWALQTDTLSWAPLYNIPRGLVPFWEGITIVKVVERNGEIVCKYWMRTNRRIEVVSYHIQTRAINLHRAIDEYSRHYYICICLGFNFIQSLLLL